MKILVCIFLFFLGINVIHTLDVYAQTNSNRLVFTKAMIDKKNSQVWFEVFNPTKENINLVNFMMSGIKSSNVLPFNIRKENALVIRPEERIIICGNKKSFENAYGKIVRIIEVKLLMEMNDKGFVGINCYRGSDNFYNIIKFDKNPNGIKDNEDILLNFSNEILSYSRESTTTGELSNWFKTEPLHAIK